MRRIAGIAIAVLALVAGCRDDEPPRARPELLVAVDDALYTMRLDGSQRRRIATGRRARWSPDGRRIAFLAGTRLAIADADGRNHRRLPPLAPLGSRWRHPQSVAWSPDGRRLAFVRALRGGEAPPFGLFTVRTDGTDLRLLVRGGPRFPDLDDPAWSPDGRRIGFTRSQQRIDAVRPDGTDGRVLYGRLLETIVAQMDWAPDGRRIAFEIEPPDGEHVVHVLRLGGRPRRIGVGFSPAWAPDGRRLAFAASTGPEGVVILRADGSSRRFVPIAGLAGLDWR